MSSALSLSHRPAQDEHGGSPPCGKRVRFATADVMKVPAFRHDDLAAVLRCGAASFERDSLDRAV